MFIEAVKHIRMVMSEIRQLQNLPDEEVATFAKNIGAPLEWVLETKKLGKLPVVNFAAGGIATPADAALMMQLGCDGIFVGSGIFKSGDPAKRAKAIVAATTYFNDPKVLPKFHAIWVKPWSELISRTFPLAKECKNAAGKSFFNYKAVLFGIAKQLLLLFYTLRIWNYSNVLLCRINFM